MSKMSDAQAMARMSDSNRGGLAAVRALPQGVRSGWGVSSEPSRVGPVAVPHSFQLAAGAHSQRSASGSASISDIVHVSPPGPATVEWGDQDQADSGDGKDRDRETIGSVDTSRLVWEAVSGDLCGRI